MAFTSQNDERLLVASDFEENYLEKALYLAVETRRFEIERFWQRSLFFWGFIGAAFVGFGALDSPEEWRLRFFVSCFGLVASAAWTLQNRGAKYWQEAWEQKVGVLEKAVLGTSLFHNKEPVEHGGFFGASRYSVTRLTIILSDFTFLAWLALIASVSSRSGTIDWSAVAAFAISGITIVAMLFCGRSGAGKKRQH